MIKIKPLSLAQKLKNIVDICEAADATIDEQNLIKKGALDTGKENDGIEPGVVRKILARRKRIAKDPAETTRLEDLMTDYQFMLGEGREDTRPWTQTDDEISRVMALTNTSKPPKIEAIKKALGCSQGKAHKLRSIVAVRLAKKSSSSSTSREHEHLNSPISSHDSEGGVPSGRAEASDEHSTTAARQKPEDGDDGITPEEGVADAAKPVTAQAATPREESCGGVESRHAGEQISADGSAEADNLPIAPSTIEACVRPAAGVAPGPQEPTKSLYQRITGSFDDIAGPMPAALRRVPA